MGLLGGPPKRKRQVGKRRKDTEWPGPFNLLNQLFPLTLDFSGSGSVHPFAKKSQYVAIKKNMGYKRTSFQIGG